jgi:hypothetical protein
MQTIVRFFLTTNICLCYTLLQEHMFGGVGNEKPASDL